MFYVECLKFVCSHACLLMYERTYVLLVYMCMRIRTRIIYKCFGVTVITGGAMRPELSNGTCDVWDGERWTTQNTVQIVPVKRSYLEIMHYILHRFFLIVYFVVYMYVYLYLCMYDQHPLKARPICNCFAMRR